MRSWHVAFRLQRPDEHNLTLLASTTVYLLLVYYTRYDRLFAVLTGSHQRLDMFNPH